MLQVYGPNEVPHESKFTSEEEAWQYLYQLTQWYDKKKTPLASKSWIDKMKSWVYYVK